MLLGGASQHHTNEEAKRRAEIVDLGRLQADGV